MFIPKSNLTFNHNLPNWSQYKNWFSDTPVAQLVEHRAQLVEHRAAMREVVSSTPAGPTLRVLK